MRVAAKLGAHSRLLTASRTCPPPSICEEFLRTSAYSPIQMLRPIQRGQSETTKPRQPSQGNRANGGDAITPRQVGQVCKYSRASSRMHKLQQVRRAASGANRTDGIDWCSIGTDAITSFEKIYLYVIKMTENMGQRQQVSFICFCPC